MISLIRWSRSMTPSIRIFGARGLRSRGRGVPAVAAGFAAEATLEELLDLAAVGTISDLVPLSPPNWALAHAGLKRLRASPRPGCGR